MDRKTQILEAAEDLLQTRSFSAFSYRDLSDRLGITKASIHHHFRSKEDLGRALTDRAFHRTRTELDAIGKEHRDPWRRFDAWVELMAGIMRSGNKICASGVLQTEHNLISESMRAGIGRQCRVVHSWLAGVLEEGRRKGRMEFPGTPNDQATLLMAAVQGALQMARAEGALRFVAVTRQLREGMKPQRRALFEGPVSTN